MMIPAVCVRKKLGGRTLISYFCFDKGAVGTAKKLAKIWQIGYGVDCWFEMVEENGRSVFELV
jgi:hypothetical protein